MSSSISLSSARLCAGDQILEVNGEALHGLTHSQALQKFKVRLPSGFGCSS